MIASAGTCLITSPVLLLSHCHHYTIANLVNTKIKMAGSYFHRNIKRTDCILKPGLNFFYFLN